jgi:hypothetical protein
MPAIGFVKFVLFVSQNVSNELLGFRDLRGLIASERA